MAKPDITAIAATFENLVEVMYPQMVAKRAEMLNGALDGLISNLKLSADLPDNTKVAALENRDMTRDAGGKGIV